MRQSTSHPCNHYARLAMARVIQSASTAQQLSRKVEFDACHPVVHHTGGPCDRGAAKFIIESKCILCGSNKVFFSDSRSSSALCVRLLGGALF